MRSSDQLLALAFNEWLRRYEQEPERFEAEFRTIEEFKSQEAQGIVPTYGEACVAYLNMVLKEGFAKKKTRAKPRKKAAKRKR